MGDDASGTHAGGGRKPAAVVKLEPTTFEPDKVTIEAGERVLWKWAGGVQHNVNGGDEFKSELQADGEYGHVFDRPGTYEYSCDVHPTTMKGTVEVTPADFAPPPPPESASTTAQP